MNYKLSIVFSLITFLSITKVSAQSDIIISQYIEDASGGGFYKAIEIFNVSGADITFSPTNNLQLYRGPNGGPCTSYDTNITGGVLAADEVWVIGETDVINYAIANGTDLSGTTTDSMFFNGDDALEIYLGGILQDQFGTCGVDPGSSWSGSGVSTANSNIQIKNGVCDGDVDGWSDPSVRFDYVADGNTPTGFGNAPSPCITSTDEVDWCNLQSPASGTITFGGVYNVYAQVYELGVTESAGQGAGITAWIGYNTSDINPNDASWTWVAATYNVDAVNNDEYIADIGSVIPSSGTYYYASRFQLNGGPYRYGGYNIGGGGFWDGTLNVNGVLTINADQVDFCNVDYPKTATITTGDNFNVYAQAYEPGVTNSAGQGANILAWIGYNTIGINHQPWDPTGWTWIAATYDSDFGNNDQYTAEIGSGLSSGTYYFASRFQLNGSDYSYGGIQADNVGNFWDSTNNNGTLTVNDPPVADVVITEIMYNTPGAADYEWIEICNLNGSPEDISNYSIRVNSNTRYTFPASTSIPANSCITVLLGHLVTSPAPECPFTPDFSNPVGTTNFLPNTSATVYIIAADGTTVADSVAYDDGDDTDTDGGGESYHVIDATMDNSSTASNWTGVALGGSPGVNSTSPLCQVPEINVEGNVGSFPDIPGDGSNVPAGFNNTLFPTTEIGNSNAKTFRIQNLGTADLNISSITITGAHAGDFSVSNSPATIVGSSSNTILEITFSPSAIDARTASVNIFSDDSNESPYTFNIEGNGICSAAVISVSSIDPASGPAFTEVTLTGNGFSGSSSVTINGMNATVISFTSTELIVEVPNIDYDGTFIVSDSGCKTESSSFTLINNTGNCGLTDLIISEIYDRNGGSLAYIEVYNGTGSTIDLSNYYLRRYGDATDFADNVYTDYSFTPSLSTIADGAVLYGKISTDTDTASPDFFYTTGAFAGINADDILHLYNGTTLIDVYEVPVGTGIGYSALRDLNTTGGNTTSNPSDWTHNTTESTSDLGNFPYSLSFNRPTVSNPIDITGCNATGSLSITASAGNGGALTYQWYYYHTRSHAWEVVTNAAFPLTTISGETTDTLDLGSFYYNYPNYQFYCLVTEAGACSQASGAAQIKTETATWNGSSWSPNAPNSSMNAILNGDYNNTTNGDIDACNLTVSSGYTLNIPNNSYTQVQYNVLVAGTVTVQTAGSLVQVQDSGIYSHINSGTSSVNKSTAPMDNWYEYTYWSSPVVGETVEDAFPNTNANRRFWYNAANYLDSTREVGNNNQTLPGQDDIDDGAPYDWQIASGTMQPGWGYAATYSTSAPYPNVIGTATFNGPFNTGTIDVTVYKNDSEPNDNNWNLVGNPYPSAISADAFLTTNAIVLDENVPVNPPIGGVSEGAIFFWSQDSSPSNSNNGNEVLNFAQSDYAIINLVTEVAGGDNVTPNRYIPSGQSFFISYHHSAPGSGGTIKTNTITFNNAMRVTGNNDQFFRASVNNDINKLHLNLTSDNGVFNQLAVAYLNEASNNYDGMHYDTPRNMSAGTFASIYTLIDGIDKKFAIQTKNLSSLSMDEIIPIGFDTSIEEPTIYTLELNSYVGNFLSTNTIYLKDKLMNIYHDLSNGEYSFTSSVGMFEDRFELVFQSQSLSSNDYEITTNDLVIIELTDGSTKFKVDGPFAFDQIEILDLLGRTVYLIESSSNEEVRILPQLQQATYIVKATLTSGQTLVKKVVKR